MSEGTRVAVSVQSPTTLSGCVILREIGRGGMGTVWLASDPRLGRTVAIKTLNAEYKDDETVRTRFMEEARALAKLNHPNIVRIYSLGPPDETPHFVMEYLEGVSLIQAVSKLTVQQQAEIMRKIAMAVEFFHQHGVVHRDLKPTNVLIGADLEPKLLDFGLARLVDRKAMSSASIVMGTPQYFSPEQTKAGAEIDERSDVFALGTMFYEVLTGTLPFEGKSVPELAKLICEADPTLPRKRSSAIPGPLQNICLKALEKEPANRYQRAREMADDLARFLTGEPVVAVPTAFPRITSSRIGQHLREIDDWHHDEVITEPEYDSLRRSYNRLFEREDAWIMEFRRLTLSQVTLYLGSWLVIISSLLLLVFTYPQLRPAEALMLTLAAAGPAGIAGFRMWRRGEPRVAIPYLIAFALMVPVSFILLMETAGWGTGLTKGKDSLEFLFQFTSFKQVTNAQMWWGVLLAIPVQVWSRRYTGATVLSLIAGLMVCLFGMATLLRMGMMEWDQGQMYSRTLTIGAALFIIGFILEIRKLPNDSRFFYPLAIAFTVIPLSGVAGVHKELLDWVNKVVPFVRDQREYLFIGNAGIYFVLAQYAERFDTIQLRNVAKVFRFLVPGHVMTSLFILGLNTTKNWEAKPYDLPLHIEARVFEIVLPLVACMFIYRSLSNQMKNFLAVGLFYLAIGILRLQQNLLHDRAWWPLTLLLLGFALMILAVKWPRIVMEFKRFTT